MAYRLGGRNERRRDAVTRGYRWPLYDEHKIWDVLESTPTSTWMSFLKVVMTYRAISIRLRAKFSSARCVSLLQPTVDAGYQTLQKAREAG